MLSTLSLYTVCNTVLLALLAAQSIAMAFFHREAVARQTLEQRVRELRNNDHALSAVKRLQRAFRKHKWRKRRSFKHPSSKGARSAQAQTTAVPAVRPRIHLAQSHVHVVSQTVDLADTAIQVEAWKDDEEKHRVLRSSEVVFADFLEATGVDKRVRKYMLRQRMRRTKVRAALLAVEFGDKVCGALFATIFSVYSAIIWRGSLLRL